MKNEHSRYPEPYRHVFNHSWSYGIRCPHSNPGRDPMKTKKVSVTVLLTVPADAHLQEIVNELGYQFTYVNEDYEELILDSELTNAVEYE